MSGANVIVTRYCAIVYLRNVYLRNMHSVLVWLKHVLYFACVSGGLADQAG